jgi:ubiquinone/menaquinone biosynthesis C-methylase UbiE
MEEKNYYNRYWEKQIDGKLLNLPPTWTRENLHWHHSFFRKYVGKNILDVGAGDGTFLDFIMKKNKQVQAFASELSAEAISIGKKKYPEINFKNESLERLSFGNEVFDTVFAIEVVEHLLDTDQCLAEINRVMKNGGYLCITTTDFNLPKKIIIATFFWNKFFYPNNPHIRFFTKATLADICKKHGFKLMEHKWNRSYFGLMPKGQMAVFKKKK